MVFRESNFTTENINKFSKIGPQYKTYTLKQIIETARKYDSFVKFRTENGEMYHKALKNNWLEYIPNYESVIKSVCILNEDFSIDKIFKSQTELAKFLNVNQKLISKICISGDISHRVNGKMIAFVDDICYFF